MSIIADRIRQHNEKAMNQRMRMIRAQQLHEDGHTNVRIANLLNVSESTVRVWLSTTVPEDSSDASLQVSAIFGPASHHWKHIFEYNMMFLRQVENHLNNKLVTQGHLFLNEVYDEIGLKRTVQGQKVGWLTLGPAVPGDFGMRPVDFGLAANMSTLVSNDGSIHLTFNVHGEIIEDI